MERRQALRRMRMPYIKQEDRKELDMPLNHLFGKIKNVGELNYCISRLAGGLVTTLGGESYTTLNAVLGVLEAAKLEFYRRRVSPYEDKKIIENGDI